MMVLRVILKGILKVYFRLISLLMKSHSNFGKLTIKCKIGLRLFLFFTSGAQNVKFIPDRKYIAIHQSISPTNQKKFYPRYRTENMVSFLPSMKFGNKTNLKGLLYLALLDRLKAEVNFFIREFFEVYFPSNFIVVVENF